MQEATYDVKVKIAKANRLNPYADITPYALEIGFPFVNYPNFYPTSEEILIYAVPASTFTDKEKVVGYTGKSSGVSVRVAKGVSLRTGGTGSRAIRDTVRQSNYGDLLVTNKRVIFVGKDDSFEFQIGKISTLKFLDGESFIIQSGRTSKNVCLDSVNVIYAYALITCSIDWNAEGKDAYTLVNESQSEITQEEMAYCDQIRQECFQMVLPKEPRPQKNKGCLVAVVVIFLVIVFLYAIGNFSEKRNENEPQYTKEEILFLENHPKIYDPYEIGQNYYDGIERVQVLTGPEHAAIERKLKKFNEDKTLLYFIQDSTSQKYLGLVHINLYDTYSFSSVTVDKAIELLISYLPDNFFEYYRKDSSYKWCPYKNCTKYVCSYRLNDEGIAYHNDGHPQYAYFYSFAIFHFEDTNQWRLETDYSAYGGQGLGWIKKYSDEWNVDFRDYK